MNEMINEKQKIKQIIDSLTVVSKVSKNDKKHRKHKIEKHTTISLYNSSLLNEIVTYEKVMKIPYFQNKYFIMDSFSPIKIGEIHPEQTHLENYEDVTDQINTKMQSANYVLVNYPFSVQVFPNWNHFFSLFLHQFSMDIKKDINININIRTFFHYYFSSYYSIVDHLILLNKNGIYPLILNGESIFFNRDKIPILTLPLCYHKKDKVADLLYGDISFLPIEFQILNFMGREKKSRYTKNRKDCERSEENTYNYFENKTKEEMENICLESIVTVNNYHLCILYLELLDKIIEKSNITIHDNENTKFVFNDDNINKTKTKIKIYNNNNNKWMKNLRECFIKVVSSNYKERENLATTKEKIENLFL